MSNSLTLLSIRFIFLITLLFEELGWNYIWFIDDKGIIVYYNWDLISYKLCFV